MTPIVAGDSPNMTLPHAGQTGNFIVVIVLNVIAGASCGLRRDAQLLCDERHEVLRVEAIRRVRMLDGHGRAVRSGLKEFPQGVADLAVVHGSNRNGREHLFSAFAAASPPRLAPSATQIWLRCSRAETTAAISPAISEIA
jgi:hypothetical protein